MNLRDDEIAFLGTDRCYCGHLEALHNVHCCSFCLVTDEEGHHFCSKRDEREHYQQQERVRGNPAVGRQYPCRACREKADTPSQ